MQRACEGINRSGVYQSSAIVEDVDFRESFGSILDSMMSDIRNDTILSKKAKKKSNRLGKVLNNIRKRKVPPCGTNTFTDPDSVRKKFTLICLQILGKRK